MQTKVKKMDREAENGHLVKKELRGMRWISHHLALFLSQKFLGHHFKDFKILFGSKSLD